MMKQVWWGAVLLLASIGSPLSHAAPPELEPAQVDLPTESVVLRWQSFHPVFEPAPCWFADDGSPAPDGVDCGIVSVPEDRSDPGSGMIPLALMRIPATRQPARSGTLVWLDPGPGKASLSMGRVRAVGEGRLSRLHDDVDLIFLDQRGTGYSGRNVCRSIKDSWTYGIKLEPDGEARFISNMRQCLEKARADGVAIDAYSSWHVALDLRDIRMALGIEAWHVFSFGTSTEIAQAMVQVDREGLRSVVLDGPVLTERGVGQAASLNMDRALRELARLCQEQPACAAAHGDFHGRTLALLDGYERAPLLIEGLDPEAATDGRLVLDDRVVATFLMFVIYSADSHADLPVVLAALEERDAEAIRNYAQAWFQAPNGRDSQLTRYAIKCRNNSGGRDVSAAALARARREAAGLYRRLGLFRYDDECRQLPYGPPDPAMQATGSDVPALITDGRLDPVGTFEASQILSEGFTNGQMVLFPYAGVSPIINDRACGMDLLRSFLADPLAPLDTGCVAAATPPEFLTEYRMASMPGRLLLGLSQGTYPLLPVLLAVSLALPLLAIPLVWTVRRFRRERTGAKAIRAVELVAWMAIATASGAIFHFTTMLLAWAGAHRTALPAAVPEATITSIWIAAASSVLALGSLWMASRRAASPAGKAGFLVAGWATIASLACLAWLAAAIRLP